ncbi:MAG: N-acetyltransferase family protein [Kiritimatiellia bacterium]|nr:GNAT family N-acetyltransferase [Lentisphaerota bacterium]
MNQTATTSNIEIRPACIDDLAAIFHLGEELFRAEAVSNLYRTWDEYAVTSQFNSEPEFMLVANAEEKLVGFIIGSLIEKAGTAWNYAHLIWLGVHPDLAGLGVGSSLFDEFRSLVRKHEIRMMLVDTQADNEAAIRFFQSKGFTNPIDHIYMTLNMDNS